MTEAFPRDELVGYDWGSPAGWASQISTWATQGYFPKLDSVGSQAAQAVQSSPGGGTENLRLMYLLGIASASRSILIANSYFVPNSLAVAMLVDARRRGVEVEIIVPGPINDAQVERRASRAKWGPLLEAGVNIYEYQPTMYHTKVMGRGEPECIR